MGSSEDRTTNKQINNTEKVMSSMTSLITSFSQSSALFYSSMSGEAVGIGLKGFFSWAVSTVIHITNIAGTHGIQ